MTQIRLSVLVLDDHRENFPRIVTDCREAGMVVERELGAIGVIVGTIEEHQLAQLRDVKGVGSVEPERDMRGCDEQPSAGEDQRDTVFRRQ